MQKHLIENAIVNAMSTYTIFNSKGEQVNLIGSDLAKQLTIDITDELTSISEPGEFPYRDELKEIVDEFLNSPPVNWDFDDMYMLFLPYLTATNELPTDQEIRDRARALYVPESLKGLVSVEVLCWLNAYFDGAVWMRNKIKSLDNEHTENKSEEQQQKA